MNSKLIRGYSFQKGKEASGSKSSGKRVLVFGSRNFDDIDFLTRKLDELYKDKDIIVISGNARGADRLGERWAMLRGKQIEMFLPDWKKFGKAAGVLRNSDMVSECDEGIAFWDGTSKGTLDTIKKMKKEGKKCEIVNFTRS